MSNQSDTDPERCETCEENEPLPALSECRECVNTGLPDGFELPEGTREKAEQSLGAGADHQFVESDLPELATEDVLHLQRQYSLHGRERVVGWLRAKVALPTRLELAQLNGKDVDEEAYYEWVADQYVDTDAAQTES